MGSSLSLATLVGVCLLLAGSLGLDNAVTATPSQVSGNFVSSFVDQPFGQSLGNGTFTVSYRFPSEVVVGSNLTTQVSLQVNELNVLQQYVEEYQITVEVAVPNGQVAVGRVTGASPLFPGAIWGPENVTIPITSQVTGAFTGSLNATVNISLATTVRVGAPANQDHSHSASQLVGNLAVTAVNGSGGGGDLIPSSGVGPLPYLAVAVGVALVSVGVLLPRISPEKRPGT